MKAYYQPSNSTYYTKRQYQTQKTYHVKPKPTEELKVVEPEPQSQPDTLVEQENINNTSISSIPSQQAKKPERQLYSARDRQKIRQEVPEQKFQAPAVVCCDLEENEYQEDGEWENCESETEEKDTCLVEDDGRESVSNVSTAMTDGKHEEHTMEVLLDVNLATEDGVMNVRIYDEGEEGDYEELVEQMCLAQKLDARMNLYFKINMFHLIKERKGHGCRRVDGMLNKLLDINYKLIMFENGLAEADQMIAPYIVAL